MYLKGKNDFVGTVLELTTRPLPLECSERAGPFRQNRRLQAKEPGYEAQPEIPRYRHGRNPLIAILGCVYMFLPARPHLAVQVIGHSRPKVPLFNQMGKSRAGIASRESLDPSTYK